jgi:hypothetical protein
MFFPVPGYPPFAKNQTKSALQTAVKVTFVLKTVPRVMVDMHILDGLVWLKTKLKV